MATPPNPNPDVSPVLGIAAPKLDPATKARIEALGEELKYWQGQIDKVKALGLDTTNLQAQYDKFAKVRELLLKQFG